MNSACDWLADDNIVINASQEARIYGMQVTKMKYNTGNILFV